MLPLMTVVPRHEPPGGHDLAGLRAVVLGEDGVTLLQLERILARAGVVVAATGMAGPAAPGLVRGLSPDLVVLDAGTAVADCADLARQIVAETGAFVTFLSSFSLDEREEELVRRSGADLAMVKPVAYQEFIPRLAKAYRVARGS